MNTLKIQSKRPKTGLRLHVAVAALAGTALLGGFQHASAQAVTVDEGTFDISIRGSFVGSEAFSIVRRGTGDDQQTLARAQVRLDLPTGTRTLQPLVRTVGEGLEVTQYQLQATGEAEREVRLDRSGERRMHATIVTADGEREQEFRFEPGAILLENNVAHHFHFLGSRIRAGATSVLVIRPTQRNHATVSITRVGDQTVEVAGTRVSAVQYSLAMGDETRSVWFDSEWRVLRVDNGSQSYSAVRRALP